MPKSSPLSQTMASIELSKSNAVGQSRNTSGLCCICRMSGANSWLKAPDRFHGRPKLYELVRCPSCSLVWLDHPPPPSEMGRHYGAAYDRAIAGGSEDPEHWTWRRDE